VGKLTCIRARQHGWRIGADDAAKRILQLVQEKIAETRSGN